MIFYKLVMPGDINNNGFLFGGKLLMWLDEFAWLAATADYPASSFVTRALSEVSFNAGVEPSSVLRFDAQKTRTGRTSVTYHVDVYARMPRNTGETHVFHTNITFVNVDASGRKIPLEETSGPGNRTPLGDSGPVQP